MNRTATTEQVAAALHVKPATVRKYAREQRLPYDTTPGGHRRFDVDEAVRAVLGDDVVAHPEEHDLVEPVPFVRVDPETRTAAVTIVTEVVTPRANVHDTPEDVEDWAAETTVV